MWMVLCHLPPEVEGREGSLKGPLYFGWLGWSVPLGLPVCSVVANTRFRGVRLPICVIVLFRQGGASMFLPASLMCWGSRARVTWAHHWSAYFVLLHFQLKILTKCLAELSWKTISTLPTENQELRGQDLFQFSRHWMRMRACFVSDAGLTLWNQENCQRASLDSNSWPGMSWYQKETVWQTIVWNGGWGLSDRV